jgi:hypothetical protein
MRRVNYFFFFFAHFARFVPFVLGRGLRRGTGGVTTFVSESKSEMRDISAPTSVYQLEVLASLIHFFTRQVVSISGLWRFLHGFLGAAIYSLIEFSMRPCVQPQTVDGHLIGRPKPNRQFFFCPRGFARYALDIVS